MSDEPGDAGEAGVYPGKGSFRGLVAQLTSELGERLLQEHEARVSALAREIDWLSSEVCSLGGASRALRFPFRLGEKSNGISSEGEALPLRSSGGGRRSSSTEGSDRGRDRQFEACGFRGNGSRRASSCGDSDEHRAERQREVLPFRSCLSKGRSGSTDLDERPYEASISTWANPWVEQQQNAFFCSSMVSPRDGSPRDGWRRGHASDGAESALQKQYEVRLPLSPAAAMPDRWAAMMREASLRSPESPRGMRHDSLLRRGGSRESTSRSCEEPRGARLDSLLQRSLSCESSGRSADRRGLSRESSCRSLEAPTAAGTANAAGSQQRNGHARPVPADGEECSTWKEAQATSLRSSADSLALQKVASPRAVHVAGLSAEVENKEDCMVEKAKEVPACSSSNALQSILGGGYKNGFSNIDEDKVSVFHKSSNALFFVMDAGGLESAWAGERNECMEANLALTNASSGPQTSLISTPLHEPSLQPEVDFDADGEIPDPPPDPQDGLDPGGVAEEAEENRPSVQQKSVSITCEMADELVEQQIPEPDDPDTYDPERFSRGGSPGSPRRLLSPSARLDTEVDEQEDLFEIRGPWVLTEETIQRMRTKSSMLVVVTDDPESAAAGIVNHLGRFVKTLSLDIFSEWSHTGRFIVHPQSLQRVVWDLLTILLVGWDFIMVPLLLFFDPPTTSVIDHVDFGTHIFWTLDIPASFMTGVFEGSRLIMKPCIIAKRYLKSWFLVDMIIVVPEWITIMYGDGKVTTSFSALKGLKAIRVLRLLRLLKLDQTLREFQVLVNSNYLTITLGLVKLVVGLVFLNHFLACCWYAIGNSSSEGWVNFVIGEEINRTGQDPTLVYLYLMALHWSFTQFHSGMELVPTNWQERLFAVVVVLFALMCISSVLSSMTDMVIELQTLRRDEVKKERILRKYLWEHQISMQLSVRVKKYLQTWVDYRQKKESEYELFRVLPQRLLTDLHDEARSPVLVAHSLFADIRSHNARACRHICHACIEELAASASETLFTVGDACTRMLFVESGNYTYRKKRMSVGRLEDEDASRPCDLPVSAGAWVSEASLWTAWTNFGDFNCVTPGILLALDANSFATVVHQYEETWLQVALYARRFVRYINRNQCGDLIVSIDHDRRPTRRFSTTTMEFC